MATTYSVLGYVQPSETGSNLYQVDPGKSAVVSTLHAANITSSDITITIWVIPSGDSKSDYTLWAKNIPLAANSIFSATQGLTLEAGAKIVTACTPAYSANFYAFGSEVS